MSNVNALEKIKEESIAADYTATVTIQNSINGLESGIFGKRNIQVPLINIQVPLIKQLLNQRMVTWWIVFAKKWTMVRISESTVRPEIDVMIKVKVTNRVNTGTKATIQTKCKRKSMTHLKILQFQILVLEKTRLRTAPFRTYIITKTEYQRAHIYITSSIIENILAHLTKTTKAMSHHYNQCTCRGEGRGIWSCVRINASTLPQNPAAISVTRPVSIRNTRNKCQGYC